jgi:hypothetical protein
MGYANVSRPMGFIPLALAGKSHGNVTERPVPAARTAAAGGNASLDLAIGDAYAIDANGNAYRAGPNDVVRGIVIGVVFQAQPSVMNANGPLSIDYITGLGGQVGTTKIASIIGVEDNSQLWEVQADTFAAANVGGSFNLADAAPDATYRQSRQTINIGAGAGTQFQAVELVNRQADNAYGANARVVVRMKTAISN